MCLFPKLVKNPKYKANKKNKGNVPHMPDGRVGYVPIGCGKCFECMKKKSNEWKVRLQEDIKEHKNGKFVTLTFSNESYAELAKEIKATGYALDNEVATLAVRRFLERWRKKYKKSARHWLVTELGQNGTENIHLHGIIYADDAEEIERIWKYGFVWIGNMVNGKRVNYVSERTVNYITKYITKTDQKHKAYKPKVLCSAGIGSNYIKSENAKRNQYKPGETKETYTTRRGTKIALPIYYRNKLYTEKEREKLWIEKLDENVRYVGGEKVRADDHKAYQGLVKYYREINREMGYGSPEDWEAKEYEEQRRKLLQEKRMKKNDKKT